MTVIFLLSIVIVLVMVIQEVESYPFPRYPTGNGTTANIVNILEGRCNEYIQCIPPINSNIECDSAQSFSFNCTSLVMDFYKDVAYHGPCNLDPNAFDDFVASAAQDLPPSTHLLWSGTKDIAHDYGLFTRRKTLEDSLVGFMMNDILFCGSMTTPGFDFLQCPSCASFNESAAGIFWPKASGIFASLAKGKVEVILSANNFDRPSFRNGSIFRSIEVPRLTSNVTRLTTILVRDIGDNSTTSERCGAGSLLELQQIMEDKNISFECKENPNLIRFIQCADKPHTDECVALFNSGYLFASSTPLFLIFLLMLQHIL